MHKIIPTLLITLFCLNAVCFAEPNANSAKPQNTNEHSSADTSMEETAVRKEYLAEQKVKMLPSKHGSTIDSYMTNMAKIPMAEDLGWMVYTLEDGYEVERSILINKSKTFRYKWKVSNSGEVTPVNDRAKSLMK